MERVHYRRYAPSKLNSSAPQPERVTEYYSEAYPEAEEKGGFLEKLIVQGIISGVIFAVVLVIGMLDNPQAVGIRNNLSEAISAHTTAEQVAAEVRRFLGEEDLSALAGEAVYIESVPEPALPVIPAIPDTQITAPRIDEEMMREVFGESEGDDLQTTAPEPIALPEL